jgi:hypothetical protein
MSNTYSGTHTGSSIRSHAEAGRGSSDEQLSLLALVEEPVGASASTAKIEADREERRYRRLIARKERMGDLSGMAACYIRLGDVFLARGDSEQAGDMYRKSLQLARSANNASKGVSPDELL